MQLSWGLIGWLMGVGLGGLVWDTCIFEVGETRRAFFSEKKAMATCSEKRF